MYPTGEIEHKYMGPDTDVTKTQKLRDQCRDVQKSLNELTHLVSKIAELSRKRELLPGKAPDGFDSYFLCKHMKAALLKSRSYLVCGVRPEVQNHVFTFPTLSFAKTARTLPLRVILSILPASPAEKLLQAELAQTRNLVEELQTQMARKGISGPGHPETAQINYLQRQIVLKQQALRDELSGLGENGPGLEEVKARERQLQEYGKRGMTLLSVYGGGAVGANGEVPGPGGAHLINLDRDRFRSRRMVLRLGVVTRAARAAAAAQAEDDYAAQVKEARREGLTPPPRPPPPGQPTLGEEEPFVPGVMKVGAKPNCDFQLQSLLLMNSHCYIEAIAGKMPTKKKRGPRGDDMQTGSGKKSLIGKQVRRQRNEGRCTCAVQCAVALSLVRWISLSRQRTALLLLPPPPPTHHRSTATLGLWPGGFLPARTEPNCVVRHR
jgi:hypothetical protein